MGRRRGTFRGWLEGLGALTVVVGVGVDTHGQGAVVEPAVADEATAADAGQTILDGERTMASAPTVERQTIRKLLAGGAWPRRALAAMRLERFTCAASGKILRDLLGDEAWQVRAFAIRSLGRRRLVADPGQFDTEDEPYVLRAALRYRYPVNLERLERGVRFLARSDDLSSKMLAAELGVASGDAELVELARESTRTVILRMGRADAGALSPRLSVLTGTADMRRHYRWQQWLRKRGRRFSVQPDYGIPSDPETPVAPSALAQLAPRHFAALESYIEDLGNRSLEIVICLDCTASMTSELSQAQGGIDDLMLFVGDVVAKLRVAIVAYRDKRDAFEVRWWDFTENVDEARHRLWTLTAAGGGDRPEAVYPALRFAYTGLTWTPETTRSLILIGDAPPHPGYGGLSVDLARRAALEGELTTHVIQSDRRPVKHFPEIAAAGGGRLVELEREGTGSLVVELAGLTIGERFDSELREFFLTYMELCR